MNSIKLSPDQRATALAGDDGVRSVVVDGVRQVYRVVGEGPVCLVHSGGPGVDPQYLRIPALESRLTMVYVDPVGSGESDLLPDGDYSLSRYASFARSVLDDLGVPKAYFLGHSHGGFVGLQFGIDSPDRLDGLILYDTSPQWTQELTHTATKEMAAFARRWPDRPEAAEAGRLWEAAHAPDSVDANDLESHQRFLTGILPAYFADYRKTVELIGAAPTIGLTHDPNRLPVQWDVRDQLGTIDVPALVIVGTYDFICAPRFAYEIQAGLPDARLVELRDSGHFGHVEEPDAFAEAVVDFIYDIKAGERA
jgi:proline iminopeptidase